MKKLLTYLAFVSRRFVEDRCLMVAGSLTYTTLVALVPVLAVTLVLTARLPHVSNLISALREFAMKALVPDVGSKLVSTYVDQFSRNAAELTALGLAIVFGTSIALLFTIDGAFNDIWRSRRRRSWLKRLAAYVAVLAVGPILIGASLMLTSYLVHAAHRLERVIPLLDDILFKVATFSLTGAALVLAYTVMPARRVPWRHALVGGLVAGLLFELVKYGFVSIVVKIPTYSLIYGTFASVPIFLVWLFCCWMAVLIGAQVAATLSYFRSDTAVIGGIPRLPVAEAMRVFEVLVTAAEPIAFEQLRARAQLPIDTAEDILHALEEARLVKSERGRYQLALQGDAISQDEVIRAVNAYLEK
ncbi:MAG TPA: YihY family inner membrane protein [Usitatibacteraceae bacterium]|nr:YihY family inner membrane protein [Usitatibacteraceae bacterium]